MRQAGIAGGNPFFSLRMIGIMFDAASPVCSLLDKYIPPHPILSLRDGKWLGFFATLPNKVMASRNLGGGTALDAVCKGGRGKLTVAGGLFRNAFGNGRLHFADVEEVRMMGILLVLIVIIFVCLAIGVGMYNRLVSLKNQVNNAWSQIDVQLKKRHDLVPNLVETVKGYAAHEKGTLEMVTAARGRIAAAATPAEQVKGENQLTQALRGLLAVAEAYPELKANQNFLMLQEELSGLESKIAYARQAYNDAVMSYETTRQSFPWSILAGMGGFSPREYLAVEEGDKEVPKVAF